MTIQFQGKTLYSFWRALMLPDIQRQYMLQQEYTSKDNQSSRNSKNNFKCMLRNTYIFKMSLIFKLNNTKKATYWKEFYLCDVSCNNKGSHGIGLFFFNILIICFNLICGFNWPICWGSLSSDFVLPYLPKVLHILITSCYSFLLVFVSLMISPLYLPAPDFLCQLFLSEFQNLSVF